MSGATHLFPVPIPNRDLKTNPDGSLYWGLDSAASGLTPATWTIIGEVPSGTKDSVNLEFRTEHVFTDGTLQVFLSGLCQRSVQSDAKRDVEYHGDRQGFTFILQPNDPNGLREAPAQNEPLVVNYIKEYL